MQATYGQERYIPTLVGRFGSVAPIGRVSSVHPHACGEIGTLAGENQSDAGTSPRLWGDFSTDVDERPTLRYIPTLVGRFYPRHGVSENVSVHPHACGEIALKPKDQKCGSGTSPRLWGDFDTEFVTAQTDRYIPTLVGRLKAGGIRPAFVPVHPHACGEILASYYADSYEGGTSPRLWGDSPVTNI